MNSCIFCNIINQKLEANIVYEDDLIIVFMDHDPINLGHLLIATKTHKLDLDELTHNESTRVMDISKMLLIALKNTYPLQGYSIMQNGGKFNDIGHYHLHIFPRYDNDGFSLNCRDIDNFNSDLEYRKICSSMSQIIDSNTLISK